MGKNGEALPESRNDSDWDSIDKVPFRGNEADGNSNEKASSEQEQDPSAQKKKLENAREDVENVFSEMASTGPTPAAQNQSPVPQTSHHKVTAGEIVGRTAVAAGSTALLVASTSATILFPVAAPLTLPVALCAADSIFYNINGVNGSMFKVNHKNHITQRINPLPVLLRHRGESSAEIFNKETRKLFEGLKRGETYSTRSHAATYALLRNAQKEGLISDLSREETGKKSRLLLENIVTGNWKAIRDGKKHNMYNISFKVL